MIDFVGWAIRYSREPHIRRKFANWFGFRDPRLLEQDLYMPILACVWPWVPLREGSLDSAKSRYREFRPYKLWHRIKGLLVEWNRLDPNRGMKTMLNIIITMGLLWVLL